MNLYQILGINPHATDKEIRKKYRQLALKFHPDRGGDAEQFKQISKAYEILGDSDKRKLYDTRMIDEEGNEVGFFDRSSWSKYSSNDIIPKFHEKFVSGAYSLPYYRFYSTFLSENKYEFIFANKAKTNPGFSSSFFAPGSHFKEWNLKTLKSTYNKFPQFKKDIPELLFNNCGFEPFIRIKHLPIYEGFVDEINNGDMFEEFFGNIWRHVLGDENSKILFLKSAIFVSLINESFPLNPDSYDEVFDVISKINDEYYRSFLIIILNYSYIKLIENQCENLKYYLTNLRKNIPYSDRREFDKLSDEMKMTVEQFSNKIKESVKKDPSARGASINELKPLLREQVKETGKTIRRNHSLYHLIPEILLFISVLGAGVAIASWIHRSKYGYGLFEYSGHQNGIKSLHKLPDEVFSPAQNVSSI